MKKKLAITVFVVFVFLGSLAIGGGIWVYSNGLADSLRGGIAQNSGRLDEALADFKQAYSKNPNAFMAAHDIACVYALKGDQEACFQWLRVALKSSYAHYAKEWAKTEPDFRSVRSTPEFQSLIFDAPKG